MENTFLSQIYSLFYPSLFLESARFSEVYHEMELAQKAHSFFFFF
jgi:hypothetical protein